MPSPRNSAIETVDGYIDNFAKAKDLAITLVSETSIDVNRVFENCILEEVEQNIVKLNEISDKAWLLSSILLYSVVFDKSAYMQSGLTWKDYIKEGKIRLGMAARDISESLSAARFFIKNYKSLEKAGWTPAGSARKLARAELALELSGSLEDVIDHLVSDSHREFVAWYQSFTTKPALPVSDKMDVEYKGNDIIVNGKKAVSVSKDIEESTQKRLHKYLEQIFTALQAGLEPAIVPCYDEKEANVMIRLRDNNRKKK